MEKCKFSFKIKSYKTFLCKLYANAMCIFFVVEFLKHLFHRRIKTRFNKIVCRLFILLCSFKLVTY